jgi:hypothetical protein
MDAPPSSTANRTPCTLYMVPSLGRRCDRPRRNSPYRREHPGPRRFSLSQREPRRSPSVLGGIIAFPLPEAPQIFRLGGDLTAGAPDELSVILGVAHAPDDSGQRSGGGVPLRAAGRGRGRCEAAALGVDADHGQDRAHGLPGGEHAPGRGLPQGARNHWKSAFFRDLSDEAVAIDRVRAATGRTRQGWWSSSGATTRETSSTSARTSIPRTADSGHSPARGEGSGLRLC